MSTEIPTMMTNDSTRKWRVLQVISSSATSGAERHLVILSKTLQERGHQVVAACPPSNWLPAELQRAGVRTLSLPMQGVGSVVTLTRLARLIRQQEIDIIHTHLTRASYYGLLLSLLTRKPVVSTVHVFTSDPAYRWLSRMGHSLIAVSEAVRRWLIEHGVSAAEIQTVHKGLVRPQDDPLLLPRVPIAYSDGAGGLLYRLWRAWRYTMARARPY